MELIYKDKHVVVCIKPVNTLSEGEGESCLPTLLSRLLAEQGESNTDVFPVHRLDTEIKFILFKLLTSGHLKI